MKSTIDICSALSLLLNSSYVKDEISGKIYIGDFPDGNQKENITINVLNNPNKYLQNGFVNLNIYCFQLNSGRANLKRFKQIIEKVFPLVEDVSFDNYHFQIDDDKGVFKDQDSDGMYFYNIRLEFQTIN